MLAKIHWHSLLVYQLPAELTVRQWLEPT